MSIPTTSDDSYIDPVRCKVKIDTRLGENLYIFDSFEGENLINVFDVDVTIGIGQTGTFSVMIEDSAKMIDVTRFGLGNKVTIYAGKTQGTYQPIITGFCRTIEPVRRATGVLEYTITGFGAAVIFNERIINLRRVAQRTDISTGEASDLDSRAVAWRIAKSIVEDTDIFPILTLESLKSQGGFTTNGIDRKVNEFVPAIIETGVEASHSMDTLANLTGSDWGVDATGDVFLRHSFLNASGITIKDTVEDTDRADRTSYFEGEWRYTDSMRKEDGFSNRIFARTSTELIGDIIDANSEGFTDLYKKAVAQMIVPTAPRFRNISFIVSKVGNPQTQFNLMHGRILLDNNGLPTGNKIAEFQFSFNEIQEQPTNIYKINLTVGGVQVEVGKKYWVVLYERGSDIENTIRWHHNNDFTSDTNIINKNSAISDPSGQRTDPDLRWNVSTHGPVYAIATFDSLSHLIYGEDPLSVDKYGPVEIFLDVQGLDDVRSMDRYIHSLLEFKAKPQRFYTINAVTIPDRLFFPGSLVTIIDNLSGNTAAKNIQAEVQEVHYHWNAREDGLGIRRCEIRPLGFYDFLAEQEIPCN